MDTRLKKSRWLAEMGMVFGVALEMMTPLAPAMAFLPIASVANMCKGLAALAGGASKAAFHRHFAIKNNLADVTAMSHSQHTAAYTLGTGLGVLFSLVSAGATGMAWSCFLCLASLQMWSVRQATASLELKVLDGARGPLLIHHYLKHATVPSPASVKEMERFEWPFDKQHSNTTVVLGCSIASVFDNVKALQSAIVESNGKPYLIKGKQVVLQRGISDKDIIAAAFDAHGGKDSEGFIKSLEKQGWHTHECAMAKAIRSDWGINK